MFWKKSDYEKHIKALEGISESSNHCSIGLSIICLFVLMFLMFDGLPNKHTDKKGVKNDKRRKSKTL